MKEALLWENIRFFEIKWDDGGRWNYESLNLGDNENEYRISLDVYITHDFIMELLSHGLELEVIEPKHLKETIIMHHKGALEKYNQQ